MNNNEQLQKGFGIYLLITCALCGALIMVIEVMGSRVIGPFFGVSLFVWTSLISVTLVALALGYAVGGIVSDNYQQPKYLYGIILIAALFVLIVPLIKEPVLRACMPLGLRTGSFASTLLLFGPSLFLLGCVSPYLVKIAARQLKNLGRIVGGLYALSTIGSTVGTVLTGFVLIAFLGVDNIFILTGLLLIILSVGYFVVFDKRYWVAVFLIVPLIIFYSGSNTKEKILEDGTKITKVYEEDTYYGNLKVVDYSYGDMHIRELLIDGMIQGGLDMNNRLPIYDYAYYLQFLSHMLHPSAKNCLLFGLGMGAVAQWYEQQGVSCDVVEIDPAVIDIARKYFSFKNSGHTYAEDARYFLEKNSNKYDLVILDVFNGDITPGHLLSVEALRLVNSSLAPNGVLSINLIGSLKKKNYMTASVIKTIEKVFNQVEVYPVSNVDKDRGIGNIAVLAYNGPSRNLDLSITVNYKIHPRIEQRIRENIGRRYYFPENTPAMILTDDYNPIDFHDSWLRELIRQGVIKGTDWDILLS